ncbi:ribosomal protein L17-like protein, partial [Ostreococcus tauri]
KRPGGGATGDARAWTRSSVASTFGVETEQGKWTMIRHGKKDPKLNRPADQRKALLRGLTTELLRHGTVTTTMARAKAMRKPVENMIQLAKDGDDYKKRMVKEYLYDDELAEALFEQVPQRYAERNGGYTRIVRTLNRRGDNAEMGVIRLV